MNGDNDMPPSRQSIDKDTRRRAANGAANGAVDKLCPRCGLCCNGVLFEDVELQSGHDPARMARLGLELHKKGRKTCFAQPCSAFDGTLCRVYASRPVPCRDFACRLLRRVQAGQIEIETAWRTIAQARRLLRGVERHEAALGSSNRNLPLMERYARAMAQPIDLAADPNSGQAHGRLLGAMDRLMHFLDRNFRDSFGTRLR